MSDDECSSVVISYSFGKDLKHLYSMKHLSSNNQYCEILYIFPTSSNMMVMF